MSASTYEIRASWPAAIQERLGEMEDMHRRSPHDRSIMLRLARFLLVQGDLNSAQKYMRRAGLGLASEKDGHVVMMQLGAVYVVAWQAMKSINPTGDLEEVYMGEDRTFLLTQAINYMQQALVVEQIRRDAQCLVQAATAREFAGDLTDALDMLSDVITHHQGYKALPAVIFKAGAILQHLGQLEKAREYLEFLEDIDLRESGIPYSYYYAVLVTVYEESCATDRGLAKKLQAPVKNTWLSLQTWFVDERRDLDDDKYGAVRRLGKDDFQRAAVVWVDLSMECLDSCQYLLAAIFLKQAVARSPHPELLLLLSECFYMLREHDQAVPTLERAYEMDESHARIKQLLLRWFPEKYVELFREQGEEMEAAPDRYVPPGSRPASLIRPTTAERRPPSAKRPGTADRRAVVSARPGTAQSDKSSRPGTAGSDRPKPPRPPRRKVHPERSLFQGIEEGEVRRIYQRTIENKMGYPQGNEVLNLLARYVQFKTKYEVANTRIRLKHKFKTPTSVAASSSSTKAGSKSTVAASGSVVPSSGAKSTVSIV